MRSTGPHPPKSGRGGTAAPRRILLAVAAMFSVLALVVGCTGGGSNEVKPEDKSGTDAYDQTPDPARDVILAALQAMFTWPEATKEAINAAYLKAAPFLGPALREGAKNQAEKGNTLWLSEWNTQRASVSAEVLLVAAEHPPDQPAKIERGVLLILTAKKPDGQEIGKESIRFESVIAEKQNVPGQAGGAETWLVTDIQIFKGNKLPSTVCPPGQSHQPGPTDPCAPNPPPPPTICPDGSQVPAGGMCNKATKKSPTPTPTRKVTPTTTTNKVAPSVTCPSGGPTLPPGSTCPAPTTVCANGTTVTSPATCPPPVTTTCPNGTKVVAPTTCPTVIVEDKYCPDSGTYVPANQSCPTGTYCWDGSRVFPPNTCPTSPVVTTPRYTTTTATFRPPN